MALTAAQTTVTAAVPLNTAGSGQKLTISNGAAVLYLGGSNVSATTGAAIAINSVVKIELNPYEVIYGFCATSTVVGIITQLA